MHKATGLLLIALVAAGCRAATFRTTPGTADALSLHESPTPYTGVTVGDVHALIPDGWEPRLAATDGGFERGFIAAPPGQGPRGRVAAGMAAVWIDGTRVGVPSDYYYLAARDAAVGRMTGTGCDALAPTIYADHRPSYANGGDHSPGDYVAVGGGVCSRSPEPTRFAYFVAAPGYGPLHRVGIPASGLYMVVAVVPDGPRAPHILRTLLTGTQFGTASVEDFIRTAKLARSV